MCRTNYTLSDSQTHGSDEPLSNTSRRAVNLLRRTQGVLAETETTYIIKHGVFGVILTSRRVSANLYVICRYITPVPKGSGGGPSPPVKARAE
jgi:hypothetical protein